MTKMLKASDYPCVKACGRQAVAWWPCVDPDIKARPYCQECIDESTREMIVELSKFEATLPRY